MISKQVKNEIIRDFIKSEEEENYIFLGEMIEPYLSGIWWDLLDSIDYIKEDFNINPNMDTTQAAHIAEKIIRRTLEDYCFNLNK